MDKKNILGNLFQLNNGWGKYIDVTTLVLMAITLVWTGYLILLSSNHVIYPVAIISVLMLYFLLLMYMDKYVDNYINKRNSNYPHTLAFTKTMSLIKIIYTLTIVLVTGIFIFKIVQGGSKLINFIVALSIIISLSPKNLETVISYILIHNLHKMQKQNIIFNTDISHLDTVKNIDTILINKDNVVVADTMKVMYVFDHKEELGQNSQEKLKLINTLFALCNSCEREGDKWLGNKLEVALNNYSFAHGVNRQEVLKEMELVSTTPFTQERKLMTTIHKIDNQHYISITKGAVDVLMDKCTHVLQGYDNINLLSRSKSLISVNHGKMCGKGLSVIGVGFKHWDFNPENLELNILENDLVFVGMAGLRHYYKSNIKPYINQFHKNKIQPVFLTGEHELTAIALCHKLGIVNNGEKFDILSGDDIDSMTKEQLVNKIDGVKIFSRLTPQQKNRVQDGFKGRGKIIGNVCGNENGLIDNTYNGIQFYVKGVGEGVFVKDLEGVLDVIKRSRCLDYRVLSVGSAVKYWVVLILILWIFFIS